MESAIEMQGVDFSYGRTPVLEDVSLRIAAGDFVAVIGPNGGGKSTLLKLMLGLLVPQKGTVAIFGEKPPSKKTSIGFVPQDTGRNASFPITVEDAVLEGCLRNFGGNHVAVSQRAAARQAMEQTGTYEFRHRRIGELSGGQRQRVLISRALVSNPSILFLDEPSSSIDAAGQENLYALLRQLNQQMTIVVVSHDLMALSGHFRSVACVNRCVHYHESSAITPEILTNAYPCPVELVAHGVPHRVLAAHDHAAHRHFDDGCCGHHHSHSDK